MEIPKEPLNQIYRRKKTLVENIPLNHIYHDINDYSLKHSFVRILKNGDVSVRGRRYDQALIIYQLKNLFRDNLKICEVGARDGIISPFVTQFDFIQSVNVSDNFEGWGKGTSEDLGPFEEWSDYWMRIASDPSKLTCEVQDVRKLSYDDESFDIVIGTSVLNHMFKQKTDDDIRGDTKGIKELVRITKPGGLIFISLTIGADSGWKSGNYIYTQLDIFNHIINPSGCTIYGDYDFELKYKYNDSLEQFHEFYPVSNVIFTLKKN